MSNNSRINEINEINEIIEINKLIIVKIQELITKSEQADVAGDYEVGHNAEDAALHGFVRMIVSDEYSINDIKDIALKLNNAIRRKDRGARWCS